MYGWRDDLTELVIKRPCLCRRGALLGYGSCGESEEEVLPRYVEGEGERVPGYEEVV